MDKLWTRQFRIVLFGLAINQAGGGQIGIRLQLSHLNAHNWAHITVYRPKFSFYRWKYTNFEQV